ncbi:hypothetical protein BDC45DRAFT_519846 [Circinella umbellata]|nr:hypothetical protein BDC45DRAFT_519846 [Circinella umbellata]
MVPRLYPPEILKRILYYVTDCKDLAECNRINTTWRQATIPFLYERFQLTSWFSDHTTAQNFLEQEYGRHVKHLRLNMSLLEDEYRPLLQSHPIQQRTSSLRRRGFKLFPGGNNNDNNNSNFIEQRRSSLIDIPPTKQQQQRHICFILLSILQSCKYVEIVELDFHDRTFNMSRNAVFIFSQWQPKNIKTLHLMHLTRLIVTPHIQTLMQWIRKRNLVALRISHCVASLLSKQQGEGTTAIDILSGVSKIEISALSLWDPVSATNVLPEIHWPKSLRTLTILDSPDWLHQSENVLASLPAGLESLTLAITPDPSPTASFFLLQQPSYHQKFQNRFDQGLCQVLANCPNLSKLSVEGFPTLTDAFLIYLWKRRKTLSYELRNLTLARNARLSGQDLVDMVLLDHGGCFATDRIIFSHNPNMDSDFLRCVKLNSNYAALSW